MSIPICVIVPAHNAASTLQETLLSIAAQTTPPAEVIVIDDGSTDATLTIAKHIIFPQDTSVTILSQPQAGVSVSRNRAMRLTQQPVVAFLDSDDTWAPTKLAQSYDAFQASGAVLLCHNFERDFQGVRTPVSVHTYVRAAQKAFIALYMRNFICTSTVLAHRESLIEAGGFRDGQNVAEDYELWLSVLQSNSGGLHCLQATLTCWRDHPGSLSKQSKALYKATLRLAWQFYPALKAQTPLAPFLYILRILAIHKTYGQDYLRQRAHIAR